MTTPLPLALIIGQLTLGGAERQLFYIARGLDPRRFRPIVFCLSDRTEPYGSRLGDAGIEVVPVARRGHYDLGRVVRLARALRSRDIRLLHAFLLDASAYAALARPLAGRPPLIGSNRVAAATRRGLRWHADRWALTRSDRVLVNSESLRRFTGSFYRLDTARLRVVHNGLDPGPFTGAERKESVRRLLGASGDDLLVGTVGRLVAQKNPGLFLEVMRRVVAAGVPSRFVWVGEGELAGELARGAREAGLGERLVLTGPRSDIPELLKALDLFLLTSNAEGLPNVVMEAMAAERPVVATDALGTREAVGSCGIICPVEDAGALASAVVALARDRGRRDELGRRAGRRVAREFPIARMIEKTQLLYDELLGPGGARA